LFRLASVISKNRINGGFVILEKIMNILYNSKETKINMRDNVNFLVSLLRARYFEGERIEYLIKLLRQNSFEINYIKIRYVKTLLERFINQKYDNTEFFDFIYQKLKFKLEELKSVCDIIIKNGETIIKSYNNTKFIDYIKDECINESIIVETITQLDFIKYYNICVLCILNCLLKLRKNYEFIDNESIKFLAEKGADMGTEKPVEEEYFSFIDNDLSKNQLNI